MKKVFVAIAFAESAEFDTAREILRGKSEDRQTKRIKPNKIKRAQLRA